MNLHNSKKEFTRLINDVKNYFNVNISIIEKDYYVTLMLKELVKNVPGLLFKGGTSLSKCHKIIDRFSEDIDITLDSNMFAPTKRKQLKYKIIDICNGLGLKLLNKEETRSRRNYNCYRIDYNAIYKSSSIKTVLLVETVFILKSFPYETKQVSSIIYDYLKGTNKLDIIAQFELEPFDIKVQTLDRTLVDKVYALLDYMISGKIQEHSRHIYDIYKILPYVKLDDNLKKLNREVRTDRMTINTCFSASPNQNIQQLLQRLIDEDIYKADYNENTYVLLSKEVKYDEAISSIKSIIESKVFE